MTSRRTRGAAAHDRRAGEHERGRSPRDARESLRERERGRRGAIEVMVAVNGPDEPAPAVAGVEAFARAHGVAVGRARRGAAATRLVRPPAASRAAQQGRGVERDPRTPRAPRSSSSPTPTCGSPPAAIPLLVARLRTAPELAIVAGREAAMVTPDDGLVARVAALPHRFDFGNVPGRLYALRVAALPEAMPPTRAARGRLSHRAPRPRSASPRSTTRVVYLRPPTTWREYLRQRVRNEVGKLQLTHEFPELHRAHGFGRYPWRRFVREIAPREYPLVALSMAGARLRARARAPSDQARLPRRLGRAAVDQALAGRRRDAVRAGGGPPAGPEPSCSGAVFASRARSRCFCSAISCGRSSPTRSRSSSASTSRCRSRPTCCRWRASSSSATCCRRSCSPRS